MDLAEFKRKRIELERDAKALAGSFRDRHGDGDAYDTEALTDSFRQLNTALQEMSVAEEELRAQNEELIETRDECERERQRYHDLFEFCPDAYFVTDLHGVICEANRAAAKLTNQQVHRLIGKPVVNLIDAEDRTAFRQRMNDVPRLGRIEDWEARVFHGEGEPVPVIISVMVGRESGDGEGELRWLMRDLTAAKRIEDELEQMRDHLHRSEQMTAIGTLAAGLGHDVKNLLFPMRCRLDSLARQDLSEQAVDDVAGVRDVVGYLQQLASNLQLMAEKPDPSQMGPSTTDIRAWWEHVSPLMRTATRGTVKIVERFDVDLPALNVAPHLLTQAVMNLVNNASEMMRDGGQITVWAERAKHGPFVKLGITDSGPGMTPDVLRRALDPFFSTKARSRGLSTGLGLPLVRGIVKSAGGSVRIDSAVGKGTTVILRLPVTPEPASVQGETGPLPHAAISVHDTSLASTLCTLLNLSRLPSWRTDPHEPGDSKLWIVEPASTTASLAREYLRTDPDRRLVLFGPQTEEWSDVPAVWIEQTASLKEIRDALSEIAFEVLQTR